MHPAKKLFVMLFFLFILLEPFLIIGCLVGLFFKPSVCIYPLLFFSSSFLVPKGYWPVCQTKYLSSWLLEYFGTWMVWCADFNGEDVWDFPCMLYTIPHGVMPVGSLLAHFVLERVYGVEAHGYHASVLQYVPFVNFLISWMGGIPAEKQQIYKVLKPKSGTGGFVDGIAGMFYSNREKEVLYIGKRTGAFRIALETGSYMIAGYCFGATEIMEAWFDSCGVMQWLSRKLRMSIMIPYGWNFLPIPRRTPIMLMYLEPIKVEKNATPSKDEVLDL